MIDRVEDLVNYSKLAFLQGKYEESLKYAKKALDIDYKNPDAHQCAGNAYMSRADYDKAIKHYIKAVENDADNGDRYFNLGYAYASDNQAVKALEMFAKADEIGCSPNVVGQLYKIMAMLCFDMQRYNDAILNFIKSEKIIGIDMDVLQRKALSYSLSGQTSKGIEVANQIKLLAPSDYFGYKIAFNILLQEERLEEAEEELSRAVRFVRTTKDLFNDWVAYEKARYELDGDKSHLLTAVEKLNDSLFVLEPDVDEIVESYINAAEIYVQLENADMAIACLNAAENPVASFNEGFLIKEFYEEEVRVTAPSEREIHHEIDRIRRSYGDRKLEAEYRSLKNNNARPTRASANEMNLTPIEKEVQEEEALLKLNEGEQATYTDEIRDRISRLYVSAYTIKNDTESIKAYASDLIDSSDVQSSIIGRYSMVKALKDEGYSKIDEEYDELLKFIRNEMIKDSSNLFALSIRIQCYIDLGRFDEAEKLCEILSDEMSAPILAQIMEARSGGED